MTSINTYILLFIGVVCLILGWLLNETGAFFKRRRENRSKINIAIYHLLSIWELTYRIGNEKISNAIKDVINSYDIDKKEVEEFEDYFKILTLFMRYKTLGQYRDRLSQYKMDYTHTIIELSKIEPIRAYELDNNSIMIKVMEDLLQFEVPYTSLLNEPQDISIIIEKARAIDPIGELNFEGIYALEQKLKNEIVSLSGYKGFISKIRIKKYIQRRQDEYYADSYNTVYSIMKKVIDSKLKENSKTDF